VRCQEFPLKFTQASKLEVGVLLIRGGSEKLTELAIAFITEDYIAGRHGLIE
jgi:hypothetical protein